MEKRLKKVLISISTLLLIGLCYYFFVEITNIRIPCLFYTFTNYMCPGCGITRMFMALGKLDFKSAFHYNGAILILLPLFMTIVFSYTIRYIKTGNKTITKLENYLLIMICMILLVYNLFRNL